MTEDVFERIIHPLLSQGRTDEALDLLYDPETDAIKPPYDSDLNHAWYIIGKGFDRRGEQTRAVAAFERALEEWPDDAEAHSMLGCLYSDIGNHGSAGHHFRRALALDPASDEVKYNLANALFDQGKYEDAIALYQEISDAKSEAGRLARKNLKLAKSKLKKRG